MDVPEPEYIEKVALVYLRKGKLLMALSKKNMEEGIYYDPGGKPEPGETNEEALRREIKQEVGLNIDPATIRKYTTKEAPAHGQVPGTKVRVTYYFADFYDKKSRPKASSEIARLEYFDYKDKERASEVSQKLFDQLVEDGLMSKEPRADRADHIRKSTGIRPTTPSR